jgi:hypothetical protein
MSDMGCGEKGEKATWDFRANWQGVECRYEYFYTLFKMGRMSQAEYIEKTKYLGRREIYLKIEYRDFQENLHMSNDESHQKYLIEEYFNKIKKSNIRLQYKILYFRELFNSLKDEQHRTYVRSMFKDASIDYFNRHKPFGRMAYFDTSYKIYTCLQEMGVDKEDINKIFSWWKLSGNRGTDVALFAFRGTWRNNLTFALKLGRQDIVDYLSTSADIDKKEFESEIKKIKAGDPPPKEPKKMFDYLWRSGFNTSDERPEVSELLDFSHDFKTAYSVGVLYPEEKLSVPNTLQNAKMIGIAKTKQELESAVGELDISDLLNIKTAVKTLDYTGIGDTNLLLRLLQRVEGRNTKEKDAKKVRILKLLMERDRARATALVFSLLKSESLDQRYAKYLLGLIIKIGFEVNGELLVYVPNAFFDFFKDKANKDIFAELLKFIQRKDMNFGCFVSFFKTFFEYNSRKSISFEKKYYREKAHRFLDLFGTIDESLFSIFLTLDESEEGDFAKKVEETKALMFQNKSLRQIKGFNNQALATIICSMYRPKNLSVDGVTKLLGQLDDTTSHLNKFKGIKAEGWDIRLNKKAGVRKLKKGESLDSNIFNQVESLFDKLERGDYEKAPNEEDLKRLVQTSLNQMLRFNLNMKEEDMVLLTSLPFSEQGGEFTLHDKFSGDYEYLAYLKELLDEDVPEAIKAYLNNNSYIKDSIQKMIVAGAYSDNNGKVIAIKQQIKNSHPDLYAQKLDTVAEVISFSVEIFKIKMLGPLSKKLKKEMDKFEREEVGESAGIYKAYISKNEAAFFAKSTGGICIASDTFFYNAKENHMPVVITKKLPISTGSSDKFNQITEIACGGALFTVEEVKTAVGEQLEKCLVVYAINPTPELLQEGVTVQTFCEEILRVGKEFVQANNIKKVLVTGVDHGSISNRTDVQNYMSKYRKTAPFKHNFRESSSYSSLKLWEVK